MFLASHGVISIAICMSMPPYMHMFGNFCYVAYMSYTVPYGQLSHFLSCFGAGVTNLNEPPSSFLLPPHYCGLRAGFTPFRAIANYKQCEMRGLFLSLVIHYWIGDVQDCQGVSASEMTYIVSSGALNSTHSLAHVSYGPSINDSAVTRLASPLCVETIFRFSTRSCVVSMHAVFWLVPYVAYRRNGIWALAGDLTFTAGGTSGKCQLWTSNQTSGAQNETFILFMCSISRCRSSSCFWSLWWFRTVTMCCLLADTSCCSSLVIEHSRLSYSARTRLVSLPINTTFTKHLNAVRRLQTHWRNRYVE